MPRNLFGNDEAVPNSTAAQQGSLFGFLSSYRKSRMAARRKNQDDLGAQIEQFVSDCIRLDQTKFCLNPKGNRYHLSLLGRYYFDLINRYLDADYKNLACSPAVELFYQSCEKLGLLKFRFINPAAVTKFKCTEAELLNALINSVATDGKGAPYRRKCAKYTSKDYRRFSGLVNYVDALFDNVRSRLIVVRIDLKYRIESAQVMQPGQAQADLKHLFNNMKSKQTLFDDLVGYIWKLESSTQERDHFHVVLFFTSDRLKNDEYRGELVGKYWESVITQGRGTYFNCNRATEKAKQEHLCLGRIEYYDNRMRYNLLYLLAYLCKNEQPVISMPRALSRTYGRGEMPVVRKERVGRTRSINVAPQGYLLEMRGMPSVH